MTRVEQECDASLDQEIGDRLAVTAYYHMIEHGRVYGEGFEKRQCSPHIVRRSQHYSACSRDCLPKVQPNDRVVLHNENANVFKC